MSKTLLPIKERHALVLRPYISRDAVEFSDSNNPEVRRPFPWLPIVPGSVIVHFTCSEGIKRKARSGKDGSIWFAGMNVGHVDFVMGKWSLNLRSARVCLKWQSELYAEYLFDQEAAGA